MFTYILLGFFDVLVILAITFKLYRFPLLEYKIELTTLALCISVTSYVVRVVVGIPIIDPLLLVAFVTIFLRYVLIVKFFYASLLSITGYLCFVAIQMIVYSLLVVTGVVSPDVISQATGRGTYLIQISSQIATASVAAIFYILNLGFSFVHQPPHDIEIKEKVNYKIWAVLFSVLIILSISFFIMLHIDSLIIVPVVIFSLGILYYLSYRREKIMRDRVALKFHNLKNKKA